MASFDYSSIMEQARLLFMGINHLKWLPSVQCARSSIAFPQAKGLSPADSDFLGSLPLPQKAEKLPEILLQYWSIEEEAF